MSEVLGVVVPGVEDVVDDSIVAAFNVMADGFNCEVGRVEKADTTELVAVTATRARKSNADLYEP